MSLSYFTIGTVSSISFRAENRKYERWVVKDIFGENNIQGLTNESINLDNRRLSAPSEEKIRFQRIINEQ